MATLANQRSLLRTNFSNAPVDQKPPSKAAQAAQVFGAIGAYGAFWVGMALWWPTLPVVAAGGIGAGIYAALRGRRPIAAIPLLPIATGRVRREGIAHRLTETVHSRITDTDVLAEQTRVVAKKDHVLFRHVRAVPFLLELADGNKVVIAGTLRLALPEVRRAKAKSSDPALAELGLEGLPLRGEYIVEQVREGDRIVVTGEESTEAVQELAFHRDGGEATVMRGRGGCVVAIKARS